MELKNRLQKASLIDKIMDKNLVKEVEYWDNVMKRLISLTIMVTKQNLRHFKGNFLRILEFLAEFDPLTEKHLLRAKQKPISVHYLF